MSSVSLPRQIDAVASSMHFLWLVQGELEMREQDGGEGLWADLTAEFWQGSWELVPPLQMAW